MSKLDDKDLTKVAGGAGDLASDPSGDSPGAGRRSREDDSGVGPGGTPIEDQPPADGSQGLEE